LLEEHPVQLGLDPVRFDGELAAQASLRAG
jgi:hypothetical protein